MSCGMYTDGPVVAAVAHAEAACRKRKLPSPYASPPSLYGSPPSLYGSPPSLCASPPSLCALADNSGLCSIITRADCDSDGSAAKVQRTGTAAAVHIFAACSDDARLACQRYMMDQFWRDAVQGLLRSMKRMHCAIAEQAEEDEKVEVEDEDEVEVEVDDEAVQVRRAVDALVNVACGAF